VRRDVLDGPVVPEPARGEALGRQAFDDAHFPTAERLLDTEAEVPFVAGENDPPRPVGVFRVQVQFPVAMHIVGLEVSDEVPVGARHGRPFGEAQAELLGVQLARSLRDVELGLAAIGLVQLPQPDRFMGSVAGLRPPQKDGGADHDRHQVTFHAELLAYSASHAPRRAPAR
jgi:hypothetical protein